VLRWFCVFGAVVLGSAWGQTGREVAEKRCLPCHNERIDNGGLSFERPGSVTARAGKIAAAVTHSVDVKMPPGSKMPAAEIAALNAWVRQGATGIRGSGTVTAPLPFEMWTFDRLTNVGGYATKVEGHPRVVDGAVEFNGVDDALFVDAQPLDGAATFTWEVVFRPDRGGRPEQRFFHLQERDTVHRFLFEIRVVGENWFLDSYANSEAGSKTLLNKGHEHPLGEWYSVAQIYDGRVYRNYVNGVLENESEVTLSPVGAGGTSVGVRYNRRDYFKGAIARARFTRGVLAPGEFLKAGK
jgi:hypothetical protein